MTKNTKMFRFAVHVGPTCVKYIAEAFRRAGCVDVIEGTERVYFSFSGNTVTEAQNRAHSAIVRENGKNFGIKPHEFMNLSKQGY